MKSEDINRLIIITLSGILILYILISSINTQHFKSKDLLYSYTILIYDIISSIFFLLSNKVFSQNYTKF